MSGEVIDTLEDEAMDLEEYYQNFAVIGQIAQRRRQNERERRLQHLPRTITSSRESHTVEARLQHLPRTITSSRESHTVEANEEPDTNLQQQVAATNARTQNRESLEPVVHQAMVDEENSQSEQNQVELEDEQPRLSDAHMQQIQQIADRQIQQILATEPVVQSSVVPIPSSYREYDFFWNTPEQGPYRAHARTVVGGANRPNQTRVNSSQRQQNQATENSSQRQQNQATENGSQRQQNQATENSSQRQQNQATENGSQRQQHQATENSSQRQQNQATENGSQRQQNQATENSSQRQQNQGGGRNSQTQHYQIRRNNSQIHQNQTRESNSQRQPNQAESGQENESDHNDEDNDEDNDDNDEDNDDDEEELGLTDMQLQQIATTEITKQHIEDTANCTVCLTFFSEGEIVSKLPCEHLYHTHCIIGWLQANITCPICRKNLS